MAISFGNKSWSSKPWIKVVTSNPVTVSVETIQRIMVKVLVNVLLTTLEYLMVAMAAPVIGKV